MRATWKAWITLSVLPLLLSPQLASCESAIFKSFRLSASAGFRLKALTSSSMDDDVWETFGRYERTFFRAPVVASLTSTPTDVECARLCRDGGVCQFWTWCPESISTGCEVLEFCSSSDNATTSIYEPGTCILSYDPKPGRQAVTSAIDEGVAWAGGYSFEWASSFSSPPPSPPPLSPPRMPPPSPPGKSSPGAVRSSPALLSPPSPSGESSPGAIRSPGPDGRTPPPSPASRLSPPLPGSTDRIPADADIYVSVQLNMAGGAPQCYNVVADELEDAPESYGPANQPDSTPSGTVRNLADDFCNSPNRAIASFVGDILDGGRAARESVEALVYAHNELACLGTEDQDGFILSSRDIRREDPTVEAEVILRSFLTFGENLVEAGDAVGAGVCVVAYYVDGSRAREITTFHTGSNDK